MEISNTSQIQQINFFRKDKTINFALAKFIGDGSESIDIQGKWYFLWPPNSNKHKDYSLSIAKHMPELKDTTLNRLFELE